MKTFAGRKLNRKSGARLALLRSQAESLLQHEVIRTTLPKAKEVSRFAEKIITSAKGADLNSRRAVSRHVMALTVRKKIFDVLVPRYQPREGGYTQITRIGQRAGDGALMAVVRLVP